MAELLLKVGDRSPADWDYKDGDVLCAFNRRRIRCVHAEHLCHVKAAGFNGGGLRPANSLARDFREACCQYRNERVSRYEIDRVDIATGSRERLTGPEYDVTIAGLPTVHVTYPGEIAVYREFRQRPESQIAVLIAARDAGLQSVLLDKRTRALTVAGVPTPYTVTCTTPEHIDVETWLRRRLRHDRHAIYGEPGAEFWFGGREDRSDAKLTQVWQAIETKTPRRESETEFQRWPMGRQDLKSHLAIRTDEFDDARAEELVSEVLDERDPENVVIIARRKHDVPWRDVLGLTSREIQDVQNRELEVDVRESRLFAERTVTREKETSTRTR